ncbi:polyphenol oxidase family protein [Pseudomonas gingeri]|nr:polyphenol oxidase family protein [Pseudomonas gingeri]NWD03611.1 polyphenol oxidase family protein [Pseudomonas gingeri]NWE33409.1 polyphenol oxidase family protein [Pseudomonas gingeri]NWE58420.1 polyphenol oxidase family protein [Pseudomonas gingeri]NWE99753.1 polyphenol oxidase family protein [Pseudomonas gingeri]
MLRTIRATDGAARVSEYANNLSQIPGIRHGFLDLGNDGLPAEVFTCKQIHSATLIEAPDNLPAGSLQGDAVYTDGERPVAVITADCLPLLVAAADGSLVAAIHGGWKGLQGGIIGNAIARFEALEIPRQSLRIAIGPSIKACCYEVSESFVNELQAAQGHLWQTSAAPWTREQPALVSSPAITPPVARQAGSYWFDLQAYALLLLRAAGIADSQVEVSPVCTYCSSPAFGSYRRRTHEADERKAFQYSWISRV